MPRKKNRLGSMQDLPSQIFREATLLSAELQPAPLTDAATFSDPVLQIHQLDIQRFAVEMDSKQVWILFFSIAWLLPVTPFLALLSCRP